VKCQEPRLNVDPMNKEKQFSILLKKLLNTSQHVCMSRENSSQKPEKKKKTIKETNTFTLHLVSKIA